MINQFFVGQWWFTSEFGLVFPPKNHQISWDHLGSPHAPRQVCEDDGNPKKTIVFANTKATVVTAASLERRWMVGKHPRWPYDVSAIFADSWTRDKSLRIRPEVAYDPLKSVWLTQEVSIWTSSWQISERSPEGDGSPEGSVPDLRFFLFLSTTAWLILAGVLSYWDVPTHLFLDLLKSWNYQPW